MNCGISKSNRQDKLKQASTHMLRCRNRPDGGSKSKGFVRTASPCSNGICNKLRSWGKYVPKMLKDAGNLAMLSLMFYSRGVNFGPVFKGIRMTGRASCISRSQTRFMWRMLQLAGFDPC